MNIAEFDTYRLNYDHLSFDAHQDLYQRIAQVYPEQSFWSAESCGEFLAHYKPRTVLELGGWDGGLAAAALPDAPFVTGWTNFDLVDVPQVCSDQRYTSLVLSDWAWSAELRGDAFIASHILEHLNIRHLQELLAALKCPTVFVAVPFHEGEATNWMGSETTHVLPWSRTQLDAAFEHQGFHVAHRAEIFQPGAGVTGIRWYQR